ncbi:MAG: GH32 C-terminal domain-containing protein, partial [Clostridia bacterium]
WCPARPLQLQNGANSVKLGSADCMQTQYALEHMPNKFRLTLQFSFEAGIRTFGLLLHADEAEDSAYALNFEPAAHRMDFQNMPQLPWQNFATKGLERMVDFTAGEKYSLTLLAEDTMLTAYLNDQIAFTTRMYDLTACGFGLYAQHGTVLFENLMISDEMCESKGNQK